jgi:hypothetical protein
MTTYDELEEARSLATPDGHYGPILHDDGTPWTVDELTEYFKECLLLSGGDECIAVVANDPTTGMDGDIVAFFGNGQTSYANARFWSVAHNAVPTLIEHVKKLEAENARLTVENATRQNLLRNACSQVESALDELDTAKGDRDHQRNLVTTLARELGSRNFHPPGITPSRTQCDPILCDECWRVWAEKRTKENAPSPSMGGGARRGNDE